MSKKRTIDSFFQSTSSKKARVSNEPIAEQSKDTLNLPTSNHPTYPFPVAHFPPHIASALAEVPATEGKEIKNQPDLDLLYFQPYIPKRIERDLFHFLRQSLFFYKVQYNIRRNNTDLKVTTPRYTTVFGVDSTSKFAADGTLQDTLTSLPIPNSRYKTCKPRPLPPSLESLRQSSEIFTNARYNFCLVNYYANGNDSIAYHSDDEQFLGEAPNIASFSLGASRDFVLKHKPAVVPAPLASGCVGSQGQSNVNVGDVVATVRSVAATPLKFVLAGGDMLLMRGATQKHWLHSVPRRKGDAGGRINITFRYAVNRAGTENYYRYNVGVGNGDGDGEVWRWEGGEMKVWRGEGGGEEGSGVKAGDGS